MNVIRVPNARRTSTNDANALNDDNKIGEGKLVDPPLRGSEAKLGATTSESGLPVLTDDQQEVDDQ